MHGFKEHSSVRIARLLAAIVVLIAVGDSGPACAQVTRSGGGGGNAQLMQQFQQAVSERTQLQAQNAKLKKEAEDLKKQVAAAQQQVKASKAGADRNQAAAVAAARASSESSQQSLEETKGKMQEVVARFRETITQMRNVETDRSQLRQQLAASQAAYDQCAVANDSLYQVNKEVLDRYQHQGAFSYLGRSEPFTRLKQTQIDNLSLEYRQRAEELRIKKASAANTSRPPAAPSANGPPPAPNAPAPPVATSPSAPPPVPSAPK
jgi:DNA repair exonuclease SbcCD ATPase subunit